MEKFIQWVKIGCLMLVIGAVALIGGIIAVQMAAIHDWPTPTPFGVPTVTASPAALPSPSVTPRPSASPSPYMPLLGHLFVDAKIYYGTGATKALGFTVVGGSSRCHIMPSGKGVLVRYPNGTLEWKDRGALIESGLYFVRRDDPAATSFLWTDDLPGCP
jgi:hypothetical protein